MNILVLEKGTTPCFHFYSLKQLKLVFTRLPEPPLTTLHLLLSAPQVSPVLRNPWLVGLWPGLCVMLEPLPDAPHHASCLLGLSGIHGNDWAGVSPRPSLLRGTELAGI